MSSVGKWIKPLVIVGILLVPTACCPPPMVDLDDVALVPGSGGQSFTDAEGDVYDYETGADVTGMGQLDATDWGVTVDPEAGNIVLNINFAEKPKEGQFVCWYVGFVSLDKILADRPLGDPFARLSPGYAYGWLLDGDDFGSLLEGVDGKVEPASTPFAQNIDSAAVEMHFNYRGTQFEQSMQQGEQLVGGATDSLGNADFFRLPDGVRINF